MNFAFASLPLFVQHVRGGKLKGRGVAGEFGAYLRTESDRWGRLIRELNVALE
jgi:hypothetical protein